MRNIDDDFIDFDESDEFDLKSSHSSKQKKKSKSKTSKAPSAKRGGSLLPLTIVLTVVTLMSLTLSILLVLMVSQDKKEIAEATAALEAEKASMADANTFTDEQLAAIRLEEYQRGAYDKETEIYDYIKSQAETPSASFAALLWDMYDDYVVYYGSNGFNFIPINEELPLNNINNDNMVVCDSGEIRYSIDGNTISHLGIDVSAYQGEIDWEQVADFGIEYAYIRAGYRGYGSGKLVVDDFASDNIAGCLENNINCGVYFFSQAISEEEIDEEIELILEVIGEYEDFSGPIIIDVEKVEESSARGNQLSREERTQLIKRFCNKVREAGYTPVIYGNLNSLFNMLDIDQIATENIWFAFYNDFLYYPYRVYAWQYSDKFSVPGISGNVDVNMIFTEE